MYTDFKEINALYHHGIKGQKWGVIREKDDSQSKVDSEKNRLNYDAKIAKYEGELKAVKDNNAADLKIAKEKTKQTVIEGRTRVTEALVESSAEKSKTKAERDAKFKKYMIAGTIAMAALWTSRKLMNTYRDVQYNKQQSNVTIAKLTETAATKNATAAATQQASKAATTAAKTATTKAINNFLKQMAKKSG